MGENPKNQEAEDFVLGPESFRFANPNIRFRNLPGD